MIGAMLVITLICLVIFPLARAAGMADRRLEEIQRLTAGREAGGSCGN